MSNVFKPLPPDWSCERLVEETAKRTSIWIPTFSMCFIDRQGRVALTKRQTGTPFLPRATLIEPNLEKTAERGWRTVIDATLLKRTKATFGPSGVFDARNANLIDNVARIEKDIQPRDLLRWPLAKGIVLLPAVGCVVFERIVPNPNPKFEPISLEWREPNDAIKMLRVQKDHDGSPSVVSQISADCIEISLGAIAQALATPAPEQ
ncbi:hypothetical protein KBB49_01890 [Candidatus Saccharibacteria bacterium]|nr:hypothetical protein [Candidatus Saccharibacteria bacterium]